MPRLGMSSPETISRSSSAGSASRLDAAPLTDDTASVEGDVEATLIVQLTSGGSRKESLRFTEPASTPMKPARTPAAAQT